MPRFFTANGSRWINLELAREITLNMDGGLVF